MAVHIDRGPAVQLEKGAEAAAVVVVSVRDDGPTDSRQVDTQPHRVIGEEPTLPHVEEQLAAVVHEDVQAQAVLDGQPHVAGVID